MSCDRAQVSRRRLLLAAGAGLGAGLTGCAVELPGREDPVRLFPLTAPKDFPPDLPRLGWQLVVERPFATAGIGTARIAVRRAGNGFEYFGRSNWIDPAPELVQSLLIESLENSGAFKAIGRDTVGFRPDFIVRSELRDFQAEQESPTARGDVSIRLLVKIVRVPDRSIVNSATEAQLEPITGQGIAGVVAAFDAASAAVTRRLAIWIARALPPG